MSTNAPWDRRIARIGVRAVRRSEGSAGIEFGLIGSLLVLLLIGVVDVGHYAYQRLDMFAAARSGSQYFMSGGSEFSTARKIVEDAWTQAPEDAVVTVDRLCLCGGVAAACFAACADGEPPEVYTRIAVSGTFKGLMMSFSNGASDVVRIR